MINKTKNIIITLLILVAFLIGIGVGNIIVLKNIPDMNCDYDCGTLIMRQEIKGYDGYIDIPYDLNKFQYEELISWSNLTDEVQNE